MELSRDDQANALFRYAKRARKGRSQIVSMTRTPRDGVPGESFVTIVIRDSQSTWNNGTERPV